MARTKFPVTTDLLEGFLSNLRPQISRYDELSPEKFDQATEAYKELVAYHRARFQNLEESLAALEQGDREPAIAFFADDLRRNLDSFINTQHPELKQATSNIGNAEAKRLIGNAKALEELTK